MESENEQEMESETEICAEQEREQNLEEVKNRNFAIRDFVVVVFPTKKIAKHFIGQVL